MDNLSTTGQAIMDYCMMFWGSMRWDWNTMVEKYGNHSGRV